jgi:hypothetical protein
MKRPKIISNIISRIRTSKKKKKEELRNQELLKQYEEGRVLQIDNGIDNKEHLKSIQVE